jgi:hypothetical protein
MLLLPALALLLIPRPRPYPLPPPPTPAAVAAPPAPEPAATPRRPPPNHPARAAASSDPAASGPVKGVVLDPDGHPAKNASVACEERSLTATTDDEGRFELGNEADGCAAIARAPDFVPSDRVTLEAGRSNTLRLNRGGSIEGDVVDEAGAPVEKYMLAIESYQGSFSDSAPGGATKDIHDPRGAFSWPNLVPGRYVLVASTDGRPPARSRPVDVEVARTSAHVRIVLAKGAVLSGHVYDAATHKPLPGALVALDASTTTRAQGVRPARTDRHGAYNLEGAPAGPFSIRVSSDGFRSRVVSGLASRGASTMTQDVWLSPLVDGGPTGDDFAGIGAVLAPTSTGVTVGRVIPGGPAEQAGLKGGDLIRRIDGADVSALTVSECTQLLRGQDGSRVSVQVEREGRTVDVPIQRKAMTL